MKGQNLWIVLLVGLQTASVFCMNNSEEISSEKQNGIGIYDEDIPVSSEYQSTDLVTQLIFIACGVVAEIIFVVLCVCTCYRCILICRKQTHHGGLLLNAGGNKETTGVHITQPVVVQKAPPPTKENNQHITQENQSMTQPQYPPVQQFPPQYLPMQQFPPYNHPVQQFPPQESPLKQFSPQHSPMQQFSPQSQPVQQFSQHHSPMQQFSPQGQPVQQFSQQHSPMQQFQGSATTPQYQFPPESEALSNLPEPPPPYEKDFPPKY